jgi:hypothetical protein
VSDKPLWALIQTELNMSDRGILPAWFCMGVKLGSLALRGEHRPAVFENRMLRKIFGTKWREVTGHWRRLHNVQLRDLYSKI